MRMKRLGLTVIVAVTAVAVYLTVPYSPLKARFDRDVKARIESSDRATGILTESDTQSLPVPVRKYLKTGGYIGRPKNAYMKIVFRSANFELSPDKPKLRIRYSQTNFVRKPDRIALIDARMYGVPFQGYDSYLDGRGGMQGILAKSIPLFDETGADMDQACLVTALSESLLIPDAALQPYIVWTEIDATHAEASIAYEGAEASGVFAFGENGDLLSFSTEDRTYAAMNGERQRMKWTALFSDYRTKSGIRQPSRLRAVWHAPEGDRVYFDSDDFEIERFAE